MRFVQEGREPVSKALVTGGRLIEQPLLGLARKIGLTPHDCKTKRVFKVVFVVSIVARLSSLIEFRSYLV
jgi:hypothetical protein